MRLRGVERWISIVRLIVFPFVLVVVALETYPPGWQVWAWVTTVAFALGTLGLFALARSRAGEGHLVAQSLLAQAFDTAIVTGYVLVFSFEAGTPVQQILYIDLAAACLRFEILGGLLLAAASAPIVAGFEKLRVDQLHIPFSWKLVELQTGFETLMALIVGWLVRQLLIEGSQAEARAREAEQLRDELARRVDLADAAYESERRTVEELKRLSRLRADFVSLVSHEVRTPMAAVMGSAQTLRQRWRELSAEQRDAFLALISTEIDRLAALVTEVLDSSRIDEGRFSYSFHELDLGLLVNDAIAAAELGHEGIQIVSSVPQSLPGIRGDPGRLRQVLTNLIDNAIKYSPEGSSIEVRASARNGHASIEVVDHGAGIAAADQSLIFEKFGRLRNSAAKPGSGLGLYIARAIAEAHDGALEVSSSPGKGAIFTLRLPTR
jgi:signal transduction histidine kinase